MSELAPVAPRSRGKARRARLLLLALGFCLVNLRGLGADETSPVRLSARADKSEVTVGEAFVVEVEASGPPGTTYTFPPGLQSEGAELVSLARRAPEPSTAGGGQPEAGPDPPPGSGTPDMASRAAWPGHQHRYEARVFALGEALLPALTVSYRLPDGTQGEAEATALKVKVASLLPKGEEQSPIADIRPPVSVGVAPAFWMALALGLLVLGALAYALWRRLRRRPPEAALLPVRDVAPDLEARQALEVLARADHFGRGDGRGYYIALSVIAKRYLERRLGAPVLEMTTAEMLAYLREAADREPLASVMRDVALAADQVKFARGDALRAEGERHLAAVRGLVDDLEARLRPAPAPGAEEGKAA